MSTFTCIISLNPQEEVGSVIIPILHGGTLKAERLSDLSKVTKGSQDSIPGSWLAEITLHPLTPGTCRGHSTLLLTFDVDLHALGHGQPFVIVGLTAEDRGLSQTWRGRRAVRPAAERQASVYQNPMGVSASFYFLVHCFKHKGKVN